MSLPTNFAPAERLSKEDVQKQCENVADIDLAQSLLDSVPCMSMLLNGCRQIIFANQVFRDFVGAATYEELAGTRYGEIVGCANPPYVGARPGEAVGCIHSTKTEGGCGTTQFCRTCGAVKAILNSQHKQILDVQECRMLCGEKEDALDLRVWSKPVEINGEIYTLFSVMDIRDEKRKQALERIFFHDVINTAAGVKGLADLMNDETTVDELKTYAEMIADVSGTLIDEIEAQRTLSTAESGELHVQIESISTDTILQNVKTQFHSMDCAEAKTIHIKTDAQKIDFESDPTLLRRVLVNLTKNALEASAPGQTITLNAIKKEEQTHLTVHNPSVMPEIVQLQMFERSFSTKGTGRGLGTYSIKLITERYLNGKATFTSTPGEGTTFTISIPTNTQCGKRSDK